MEHRLLWQEPARLGAGGAIQQADAHALRRQRKGAGDTYAHYQRRFRRHDLHIAVSIRTLSDAKTCTLWRRFFITFIGLFTQVSWLFASPLLFRHPVIQPVHSPAVRIIQHSHIFFLVMPYVFVVETPVARAWRLR